MNRTDFIRCAAGSLMVVACVGCGTASSGNAKSSAAVAAPSSSVTLPATTGSTNAVAHDAAPSGRTAVAADASRPPGTGTAVLLAIASRDLEVDAAVGKVLWRRDGGVKRAEYDEFLFAYDDYVATVGKANLERDVQLEAVCAAPTEARVDPDDAFSQRPRGGFLIRTHACRAVKATIE